MDDLVGDDSSLHKWEILSLIINNKNIMQNRTYFSQVRKEIVPLLPSQVNRVLEIGCGSGTTLKWLKENNFVNYTIGFEISETAARQAMLDCDEIIIGNIEEQFDILQKFEKTIDLLLFLDVLEHLREPWKVLNICKTLLSDQGIIIASIPNVRSIKVIFPLVFYGQWNYQNSGILDRTHLRFFTKESSVNLFRNSGYQVEKVLGNGSLSFRSAKTIKGYFLATFNLLTLNLLEQFIANQYLILAKKISTSVIRK
ncbi:MAG: class I SAM-dependent methyltransferase [Crocosphaera sp.]